MTKLHTLNEKCEPEQELARKVKDTVVWLLKSGYLTEAYLARALGLLPEGVTNLLGQTWTIERTFRVAAALDTSLDCLIILPNLDRAKSTL